MLVTETEARCKFCPMMAPMVNEGRTCIASECMAWKWADRIDHDGAAWRTTYFSPGGSYAARKADDPAKRRGFCGLANGNFTVESE